MALTPRLDLRQSQTLVMTPQLQQAIQLLQLSNLELTAYVEVELEQNPLLERDEGERDRAGEASEEPLEPLAISSMADSAQIAAGDALPGENDAPLDAAYDNVYDSDGIVDVSGEVPTAFGDAGSGGRRPEFGDGLGDFENTVTRERSLREHLSEQLNVGLDSEADRFIGLALIDMLDECGWFTAGSEAVADMLRCPVDDVERVLATLQGFDPPGIFARDLRECLAIQLRDRDRFDPAMEALVDNLDLVAKRDVEGLLRVCGIDAEDLADMMTELRALNPKPALAFDHEVIQSVTPDILMRRNPDGGWIIELNSETLPRVLVNMQYYSKVKKVAHNRAEREYLNDRMQSANWLVKSLDQRANTILKVATEIARQQEAFFDKGIQYLRPLVLRDIAEAIEMHESTVSRVTTNKFIASPRGIFELKYFFTSSIASAVGGDAHSAESVRHRIRSLVDAETSDDILSDDRIVELLNKDGIDIARRTVAKYREALKIPSSVQRRRQKSRRL